MRALEVASYEGTALHMTDRDTLLRRLTAHRWLLIATLCLFGALALFNQLSVSLALGGCFFVACAAMFAPVQRRKERLSSAKMQSAEQTLNKSLAILDMISDPYLIIDKDAAIVYANDAFTSIFGHLEKGSSALLRFRSPEMQSLLRTTMSNREAMPAQLVDSKPLDRFFSVSARWLKLDNAENLILLHFDDLSVTKRTERLRSDFIANASHELRTPLASLLGFIETLSGPARSDAAARDKFLDIMQEQAERMSRLIDDLLTLSRFETGAGKNDFTEVQLNDVLNHVVDALRPMSEQIGTSIHFYADGSEQGTPVLGSRDELIQLFENLIENAIKYGRENGNVYISVDRSQSAGEQRVEISDDGPGIAQDHLPRLVERFYRVDVETSRGKQGTGLGLSIVKHITQRHSGRLKINSELGAGTTFTIILPNLPVEK